MKYLKGLVALLANKLFWSAILTMVGIITMTFWGKQVTVSGELIDAIVTIAGLLSTAFGWGLAYTTTSSTDKKV